MTAEELLKQYRLDMMDTAKPYLWKDEEILVGMADAYRMFARLTGGIADFTSDLSRVNITAGEAISDVDPRILRFMEAFRVSDGGKIQIINSTDLTFTRDNDYGLIRPVYLDSTPGQVRYMIIGAQRGKVKWVQVPEADDVAQLYIYRMPAENVKIDGSDLDFDFNEIGEEHHMHLVLWMRRCGYLKADSDTFNKDLADEFEARFVAYCKDAKAELERYKHKNRSIAYGGL